MAKVATRNRKDKASKSAPHATNERYTADLAAHTVSEDSDDRTLAEELRDSYDALKTIIEAAQYIESTLRDNSLCLIHAAEELEREVNGPPDGDENARYAVVQVEPFEPIFRMRHKEEAESAARHWSKWHGETIVVRENYELPSKIDLLLAVKAMGKGGGA